MLLHQRIKIKDKFQGLESLEDLLSLINYVNKILYGEDAKPVELKSLTFYSNPKLREKVYEEFRIPKKSGGHRLIHSPVSGLKSIQRSISFILRAIFEEHPNATGFIQDKSVVDNARPHTGKNYVFNVDLKDFFPSVDKPRFWKRIQYPPFDFNSEKGRLELANRISAICFANMKVERKIDGSWAKKNKDALPQGAPTSPIITNIICYRLDEKLTDLAERHGCAYTRYADDITFSSDHDIYEKGGKFRKELRRIIHHENFHIKESKTRLNTKTERQSVTGLTVNEKVNIDRNYVKQLRHWIYFLEQYDEEKARNLILKNYKRDKGYIKKGYPDVLNIIDGKLRYLKMVKGAENRTYRMLKHRFDVAREEAKDFDPEELIKVWDEQGIEAAMGYYYEQ